MLAVKTGAMSEAIRKAKEQERKVIEAVNEEPGITVDELRKVVKMRKQVLVELVQVLINSERLKETIEGENHAKRLYPA